LILHPSSFPKPAAEPESHSLPLDERSCPAGASRPHEKGWAQGSSSPAPCSEEPGPAVARGWGAEGSSRDEPSPPAPGDEAPRNELDPATAADPIAPNELSCPPGAPDPMKMEPGCGRAHIEGSLFSEELSPSIGGDSIAPNELAGPRRITDSSVPALACVLVLLLAAGLSAAWAGPVGRPAGPRDGRSGAAAANVGGDRPGAFAYPHRGPEPCPTGARTADERSAGSRRDLLAGAPGSYPPLARISLAGVRSSQGLSAGPGTALAGGSRRREAPANAAPRVPGDHPTRSPARPSRTRAAAGRRPGDRGGRPERTGCHSCRRAQRMDATAPRRRSPLAEPDGAV
jgi:hypothetical protein